MNLQTQAFYFYATGVLTYTYVHILQHWPERIHACDSLFVLQLLLQAVSDHTCSDFVKCNDPSPMATSAPMIVTWTGCAIVVESSRCGFLGLTVCTYIT